MDRFKLLSSYTKIVALLVFVLKTEEIYAKSNEIGKYGVRLIKRTFTDGDLLSLYKKEGGMIDGFEAFRKLSADFNPSNDTDKSKISIRNGVYSVASDKSISTNQTTNYEKEATESTIDQLGDGEMASVSQKEATNDIEKAQDEKLATKGKTSSNIRKNKKSDFMEESSTAVENSITVTNKTNNSTNENAKHVRDYAQNNEDFIHVLNAMNDSNWAIYNGDYFIMEFSDYNTSVPIVKLINLSVGLYNKNADPNLAKGLISAIFGTRTFSELDKDKEDNFEDDNGSSGSGIFNLDDFINWDDFDFIDEMPTLFRSLNNIIWL